MSRLSLGNEETTAATRGGDDLPLRFVTAASLFDGHDAAINVMRRLIQDSGAEVVHLGHNRSVRDVVRAAIQEDADGIAISSYQGGHTEYFKYAVEMLGELDASHIRVFGGGGGTITPDEIADLEGAGVERIYHPNDGMNLGLVGMIDDLVERARSAADEVDPARGRRPHRPRRRSDALGARGRRAHRGRPRAAAPGVGGRRHRRPRDRRHRHRRRRQVDRHRRAPLALRPAPARPAHRRPRRRPDPPPHRRRPARRPHPPQQPPPRADLHALDGDPPAEPLDHRRPRRRGRLPARRRVRPGDRRDRRHRPVRLGDRRPRRPADLRDDERVRRRLAAGEDRHARPRRDRRDQQVRQAGRRRRAPRRAQTVAPQPGRLRALRGRGAGLPDDRLPVQRPGRHLDVRQPLQGPRRAGGRRRSRALRSRASTRRTTSRSATS